MVIFVEENGCEDLLAAVEDASSGVAETLETTDETIDRSTVYIR